MISGAQIRAARGLLGWPRHELARRAVVSDATVYALETARGMIANKSTLATVQATLETAGIEFLVDSDASGLRLHSKPRTPENENPRQLPDWRAPDVSLSEFASGRKAEAPAPAAQQDKTAGRTELPHRFLESINLGFWSSSIILEFDSSALVLLFAHSGIAKARGQGAKRTAPSFGP